VMARFLDVGPSLRAVLAGLFCPCFCPDIFSARVQIARTRDQINQKVSDVWI